MKSSVFFVLQSPSSTGQGSVTDYFMIHPIRTGSAPRCPACKQILGLLKWLPPYRAELRVYGKLPGDVAFGVGEFLISERFRRAFRQARLTGMEVLGPAEIVRVTPRSKAKSLPPYFVARARRSRVRLDETQSGIIYEKPWTCPECMTGDNLIRVKQLVIDEASWFGEDLFYLQGLPGVIVASQRLAEWSKMNELTNVNLLPAGDFHCDYTFTLHDRK